MRISHFAALPISLNRDESLDFELEIEIVHIMVTRT